MPISVLPTHAVSPVVDEVSAVHAPAVLPATVGWSRTQKVAQTLLLHDATTEESIDGHLRRRRIRPSERLRPRCARRRARRRFAATSRSRAARRTRPTSAVRSRSSARWTSRRGCSSPAPSAERMVARDRGLASAKSIENMELAHNIGHGQWDWMNDPRSTPPRGSGTWRARRRSGGTPTTTATT